MPNPCFRSSARGSYLLWNYKYGAGYLLESMSFRLHHFLQAAPVLDIVCETGPRG